MDNPSSFKGFKNKSPFTQLSSNVLNVDGHLQNPVPATETPTRNLNV